MEQRAARIVCQRIGCNATFTEDNNPDGCCTYHESKAASSDTKQRIVRILGFSADDLPLEGGNPRHSTGRHVLLPFVKLGFFTGNLQGSNAINNKGPLFHDGMKEWSCCKKRSHDFSLFLEIPGCQTGKHTTEKPVLEKPCLSKRNPSSVNRDSAPALTTAGLPKQACSRCRQGFFCSDHGSQAKPPNAGSVKKSRKVVDINEPQTCKNKGCGQTFKERDNHEGACSYHPGPAVFHDRMRGWECCDVHVKEFDEFLGIPPCTRGWHSADGLP